MRKRKKFSEKEIKYLKTVYCDTSLSWDERIEKIKKKFNVKAERTVRNWLSELGIKKVVTEKSDQLKQAEKMKTDKRYKTFFITWAQNNTPVHDNFFNNLEVYAQKENAKIHVIAGRYQNPTSLFSSDDETWHSKVLPYLDAGRHRIKDDICILSDIRIRPTAVTPLTGLSNIEEGCSCIFGHPKLHFEPLPRLGDDIPYQIYTTGACTLPNYTDSKSGKKGESKHKIGFVRIRIVEDDKYFITQVEADENGNFHDLDNAVYDGKVSKSNTSQALIVGDLHSGKHNPVVIDNTLELIEEMSPSSIILHDVFDGESISHHHTKDPFKQYSKEFKGTNDLQKELDCMMDLLIRFFETEKDCYIVRSNHDEHLDKWLKDGDWKKQATSKNSKLYMELSKSLLEQYERDFVWGVIPEDIVKTGMKRKKQDGSIWACSVLGRNDELKIGNLSVSQHGDLGANGSRAGINQYNRINKPGVYAHTHAPSRKDDILFVGTSTYLRLDYNTGLSSWMNSHVLIHNNYKPQHIHFVRGEYK